VFIPGVDIERRVSVADIPDAVGVWDGEKRVLELKPGKGGNPVWGEGSLVVRMFGSVLVRLACKEGVPIDVKVEVLGPVG
jgi:hypothetical protein